MSSVLRVFIIALLAAGAAAGAAVAAPRPQSLPPGGAPVAALAGTFRSAQDAPFPYVFATGTERLSVAGVNAAMEQQIGVLAAQTSPVAVKVWGARYGASRPANQAELIVSEILIDSSQALPTAAPTPAVTAIVRYNLINLYATPYQSTAVVGQASGGQVCPVLGRDTAATWLYLDCNGVRGWADARLVSLSGSLSSAPIMTNPAPTPTPRATVAPTPSPTPPPVQGWRASYFANANLDGAPVLVADAPSINFDWGYGSPGAAVPVDYFSARYERTLNLAPGYYRFLAEADDGIRVWIDDQLVIDEWHGATGLQYTYSQYLAGTRRLRVEFLELVGVARVRLAYEYSAQPPPWTAEYYQGAPNKTQLLYTQGEPAGAIQLDRNWGYNAPVPGRVPADNWSARWTGQFVFESGNYIFRARADDGVRVTIDQTVVIDAWVDGPLERTNRFIGIGAGPHTITVEYYKRIGNGYIQAWWYRDASGPVITP